MKTSSSENFRAAPPIPDHEMLRLIGKGSYGEVWLARSVTGAMRAVKVVQRSDFQYDRTFEREFDGIRKFEPISRSHPGLVDILHVGRSLSDGFYFYVMELGDDRVRGQEIIPELYVARTLASDLNERGRLLIDECVDAGANLADGLHYLHQRGLAHRDVKPSNVIFVDGVAKLADIGLVAESGQRTYVGTEGFVPPEGPGSPSADIYSLGMVLYEIGTGNDRLEFPEIPAKLPEEEQRPKWRALNALVCKACAQKPKDRFATAVEFAQALRRVKAGKVKRKTLRGRLLRTVVYTGLLATVIMMTRHRDFLKAVGENRRLLAGVGATDVVPGAPGGGGGATGLGAQDPDPPVEPPVVPPDEPEKAKSGWARIFSQPGVEIWTVEGEKIGEIDASGTFVIEELPVGPVRYVLKREGYASRTFTGNVTAGLPAHIGANLEVFRPPVDGDAWENSLGNEFPWVDGRHVARLPVTAENFEIFNESTGSGQPFYAVTVEFPDAALVDPQPAVYVTAEGARKFCDWMTETERVAGYLTPQHFYVLNKNVTYEEVAVSELPVGAELVFLMCAVEQSEFALATFTTDPPGAKIFRGDEQIGNSEETLRIAPGQVVLTFKLDGYKSVDLEFDLEAGDEISPSVGLEESRTVVFGRPWTNEIGMQFVPLGNEDLLFGAHEVRVKDFRAFCEATGREWIYDPQFRQDEDHPVVKIIVEDAREFCRWLTDTERNSGHLGEGVEYRMPKDLEWSRAAGLNGETGLTPASRDGVTKNFYPWGTAWPPPAGVANLKGTAIPGYRDGFVNTAPVGSFPANALGIYDLAGNVWEWVDGVYGGTGFRKNSGIVRGGCFSNFKSVQLLVSSRNPLETDFRGVLYGFRVVIAKVSKIE